MKRGSLMFLAVLMIWCASALAAEFSPALDYELEHAKAEDFVSAIVILESPIDIMTLDFQLHARGAGLAERHTEVISALKYNAEQTQPAFRNELNALVKSGDVKGFTAYWIENLFVVSAKKDYLESLRERGDVKYVTENFRAELIEPIMREGRAPERNPLDTEFTTPGQDAIRATEVNNVLGITGQGVLVANCDTGVDGTHPALASRWRGNFAPAAECWRDALGSAPSFPADGNGHGTHVMGTITGREFEGDGDINTVGSAPNARWIATNSINQGVSGDFDNDIIADYQWFADPDGNPGTLDDVPDVIQNSWGVFTGLGYAQCFDFWNTVITNCEAAGPVITWSAGNESTSGLRSPAIYSLNAYQIFSVGAVDATNFTAPYPLASFSSQGPTPCTPASPDNIKPEISAPGVDVYSSVPGGGYNGFYSGTSMAGPHVAGVVALMREACPDCDHVTIKDAIMSTAIDYGTAGQDNQYGYGFIDAYESVLAVSNLGRVCGVVTDGVNPIAGARVGITTGSNEVFTEADGSYCLPLSEGTYTVECSAFGYVSQSAPGINIVEGDTVTQNFTLVLAPQGTVSGIVTNCAGGPAVGATVEVLNTPIPSATTNGSGFYSITLPQGTYDLRASLPGCGPDEALNVAIGVSTTVDFLLPSDPRYDCSPADPYGYTMCEDVDADGIAFDWQAVTPSEGGSGTQILLSVDDGCEGPFTFPFPFQFYGQTYTDFYVGSNGYVTFDACEFAYFNDCLPNAFMSPGLYVNWNDMTTYSGQVAYYYDAANNWLVVSWYQISHFGGGGLQSFQVIIYDQGFYSSATGDNHILFQYDDPLTDVASTTVGIMTQDGGTYSQYVCDGAVDANSWGQEPGRTVYFSTGPGCELGDADIAITPASLSGAAPLGGTDTGSFQICNTGVCPLYWGSSWQQTTPALALSSYVPAVNVEMTKEQLDMIRAINNGAKVDVNVSDRDSYSPLDAQGGPDTFGYTWIDSDEPGGPVYSWFEINGIGSNSGITGDDQFVSIALPFSFEFYGISYNSVNVTSNGLMNFGSGSSAYSNVAIPSTSAPLAMIAPFWDDLYPPAGGGVYTYYDAPNSRFVVEWDDIRHFSGTTGDIYNFQVMLYANGRIVIQYETQTIGTVGLTSATVGLNDHNGTDGLGVVYNAAYLHDNMAIEFKATVDWLTIVPPVSGVLNPGDCTDVSVFFEAGDLPAGTYTGNIEVTSNDPDEGLIIIPVEFNVGSFPPPTNLTILYLPGTDALQFNWDASGAPYYELWSSPESDGMLVTLEGSTAGTTLTIPLAGIQKRFFVVKAVAAP
ncbi:MAG: S8 family serine peptidase [Calditrichaeota bacterium]|nr:S8 family serine peptidase [Calditrichota bacterium]MCB9367063.1 S8 family serine peptidase [Calditrichota bacterium]MCB9391453.1 S8 family serine peptidase [Calditrichota bacterium]